MWYSNVMNNFIRPDEFWKTVGLRAEQTVVHLGCGAGFYLIPAAHIVGPNGNVIGIDVLPDMLADTENKARQENVENIVRTIRANLENSSGSTLPEKNADWVLVANILHQSDQTKIFTEAKRILKDNGKTIAVEWNTSATPFGPPPAERISKEDIQSTAEKAGFSLEKEFEPSPYHFGLVLTKKA